MRISDWSSDVCSSDLEGRAHLDLLRSRGLEVGRREFGDAVVATGVEALDLSDGLDPASLAAAADEDDEVDRLGHEPAWHGDHRLLDELLQPVDRKSTRLNSRHSFASRMPASG